MKDVVIPIIFPDYMIAINTSKIEFDVFPYFEFDNITIPAYKDRFSGLGHAGVLFINGSNGVTKYYEYGRYDSANLGLVRKISFLPDVTIKQGKIDYNSLKIVLKKISKVAGQSGRLQGVYIEVNNRFDDMLAFAEFRKSMNGQKKRMPYSIHGNSCIHFVQSLVASAGVNVPLMIDPRPNSYISEFRDDYLDLDYGGSTLIIEEIGSY